MLNTRLIKFRTNFSETLARLLIPIVMLFLTLILSSCASVVPQQDKPMVLAIPANWSNAADSASPRQLRWHSGGRASMTHN